MDLMSLLRGGGGGAAGGATSAQRQMDAQQGGAGYMEVALAYGARIKLQHVSTGHRLHSHGSTYPKGSKQQQVTCFDGEDANDWWLIKPRHGTPLDASTTGMPVADGDVVRLEHVQTQRNLHSHNIVGHVTRGRQLEVTAFGNEGEGDTNDNWIVRLGQSEAGAIRLQHVCTSMKTAGGQGEGGDAHCGYLHSHGHKYPGWGHGQQEVTNYNGTDANDLWLVVPDLAVLAARRGPASPVKLTFARHEKSVASQLSRTRESLPAALTSPAIEFERALNAICLLPEWLGHTRLQRFTRMINQALSADPPLAGRLEHKEYVSTLIIDLVTKGYALPERAAASTQRDAAYGFLVFDSIQALYDGMSPARRVQLGIALHFLLELASPDLIVAKLSEAGDRGQRCMSAKKLGFNLLVRCACELKEAADEEGVEGVAAAIMRQQNDVTSAAGAKEHVLACFEEFLDDHKSNAFASAFTEPARFYFAAVGDAEGERHVTVQ